MIKVKPKYEVSAMHTKKVLKCPVNLLCHAIRGNKKALMVRLNYDHEENELFGFVVCDVTLPDDGNTVLIVTCHAAANKSKIKTTTATYNCKVGL